MNELLISFIIPTYNVEKFLENTIKSILNERVSKKLFEIIIIDDGSIDGTLDIANKFLDNNIQVYVQENKGVSYTRNRGIDLAQGKYIWFFDADDMIEKGSLEKIIASLFSNEKLDLLSLGVRDIVTSNNTINISNMYNKPINVCVNGEIYIKKYTPEHAVWAFLVRRDILIKNNIYFLNDVICEDYDFPLRIYEKCKFITHLGCVAYNYIIRDGSLSRRKNDDFYRLHHASMIKIIPYIENYFFYSDNIFYKKEVQYYIDEIKILALIVLLNSNLPWQEKQKYYKSFKIEKIFQVQLSMKYSFKQKLIYFLIRSKLYFIVLLTYNFIIIR